MDWWMASVERYALSQHYLDGSRPYHAYTQMQVLRMKVADNNRASTSFRAFREAKVKYGTPSRVRGDRGGENLKTAIWMILVRGANRGSYLWGS